MSRRPAASAPEPRELVDTARTEAFSDGVLAIAITLLVLNLVAPAHREGHLGAALLDLWPSYLAFLSSFLLIGVVWLNHHAVFRLIRATDRILNWANLGLLLGAVVLPFPTSVLADALRSGNPADERSAVLLYAAVTMFIAASWYVFYVAVDRQRHLTHDHVERPWLHLQKRRALFGIVGSPLAAAVGLAVPYAALVAFVAIPVFYAATSEGLALRSGT